MTILFRRHKLTATLFLWAFCGLPGVASGQCWYEVGVWSGSAYEYASEVDLTLDAWGAGIDYSYCGGYCFHGYAFDFTVVHNESVTLYTEGGTPGVNQSVTVNTTPGTIDVTFALTVWCTCGGQQQPVVAQSREEVPPCQVPFGSLKGPSRGRLILYEFLGANLPDHQRSSITDAHNNWSWRNESSGVNVSYVLGETSNISGIEVEKGDAGFEGGQAAYGRTLITNDGVRALGGAMTISENTNLVSSGDGFRRITQHELGHFHGLGHLYGASAGTSVMRDPISTNGGSLPDSVPQCDGLRAYQRENAV